MAAIPVIKLLDCRWIGSTRRIRLRLPFKTSSVQPAFYSLTKDKDIDTEVEMAYSDIFWMACDSTEQLRAEYGPFHTREEAEVEARKLGFGYLLRYEHMLGPDGEIDEVRCVFIELQNRELQNRELQNHDVQNAGVQPTRKPGVIFHTRCASCGATETHARPWQAEVWADIHEFEHTRHKVRLFEHARGEGLKEIAGWRGYAA